MAEQEYRQGNVLGPATEATLFELANTLKSKFGINTDGKKDPQKMASDLAAKSTSYLTKQTDKVRESYLKLEKQTKSNTDYGKAFGNALLSLENSGALGVKSLGDFSNVLESFGARQTPVFRALFNVTAKLVEMLQEAVNSYRNFTAIGVSFGANINETRRVAGQLGVSLEVLQNAVMSGSRAFALLGGSAEEGANTFRKAFASQEFQDNVARLTAVGYSMDQITTGLAEYLELQVEIGRGQKLTAQQIASESGTFLMNLDLLSKVTGQQRKQILEQLQKNTQDERLKAILGGMADGGQEVLKMLSVLETASPEMANNVKDLIANMGMPQNAAQAGLVANSNIQQLLADMISGKGSTREVMAEFARLGKESSNLSMQQRSLNTLYNAQGNGFYNYTIQLQNAGKILDKYSEAQELQDAQVRTNIEGSIQFDRAMMKLRARFAALATFILDKLDPAFGYLASVVEAFANLLDGKGAEVGKVLGGLAVAVVGVTSAFYALKGSIFVIKKLLSLVPSMGGGGSKLASAGAGLGGRGLMTGGFYAGVGLGALGLGAGVGMAGIALGLTAIGKGLGYVGEGLEKINSVDGENLKTIAQGVSDLSGAMVKMGGASLAGGVSGFFGKIFGGGPENFAKNINKTLDELDKTKIDMYANSLKNLGDSFESLQTGMASVTTGASKSTGDKLDQLNTTMEAILRTLDDNTKYARITSRKEGMEAI